jgi:hypothetical protein
MKHFLILVLALYPMTSLASDDGLFGLKVYEEKENKIIKRSSKYIPEWQSWLLEEETAIRESGVFWYELHLLDKNGDNIAALPTLRGYTFLTSTANDQIVACEENPDSKGYAVIFNLKGEVVAEFQHEEFLRACGATDDGKLYWLHYNGLETPVKSSGFKPYNVIVILDNEGNVVHEEKFVKGKTVEFEYKEAGYEIDVPDASVPF